MGSPNLFAYNMAIRASQVGKQWETALSLFNWLQEQNGISPNYFTYKCVLGALANSQQWECALWVLREMKLGGVKPRISCFNHVLRALETGDQHDRVLHMFMDMQNYTHPDVVAYSTALTAAEKASPGVLGKAFMNDMVAKGVVFDIVS